MKSHIEVYPVVQGQGQAWRFRICRTSAVNYSPFHYNSKDEAINAARAQPANAQLPVIEITTPPLP